MTTSAPHVFISYSWEGSLAPKQWLAEVARDLSESGFDVFMDRRSVQMGDDIDAAIRSQLAQRPLVVLCMCDSAYCDAAKTPGTGVYAELSAIDRLQGAPDVKIVPIFLESRSKLSPSLPPLLSGRLGLAMAVMKERGLVLTRPLVTLLDGATQEVVQAQVDRIVATADLRVRLIKPIAARFDAITGKARTHRVQIDGERLEIPPCLASRSDFQNYRELESEDGQLRWWWSGRGMGPKILGSTVVASYFPAADVSDLVGAGNYLAMSFFGFIREDEPMVLQPEDVVEALTMNSRACELAERLLATTSSGKSSGASAT